MPLTAQRSLILKLAGGGALAIVLGIGVSSYFAEREARIKMQATLDAQAAAQKQYQQMFADIQKQMEQRDAAYQAQLKSLDDKFQVAASPAQIAQLVSQLMGLKQPIQIVTPTPTPDNPNPQPVAQISLSDAPQAKAYVQQCEECKLNLTKTAADLKDREAQAAIAQKQIDSLKTERDVAIKAAKGTFWSRTKTAAKWFAIGGGAVAITLAATGHTK